MSDILPWRSCVRHGRILAPDEVCPDCAPPGEALDVELLARVARRLAALHASNRELRAQLAVRERENARLRARVHALEWAHG